jgi:hypothetical protein
MLRRPLAVAAAVVAFAGITVPAYAAWTTAGSVGRSATATTLAAPGAPTAGTTTQTSADLTWSPATAFATGTIQYHVERAPFGTATWTSACGSSDSAPLSTTSCTDTGLAAGTDYQYRVTSVYERWRQTGATSAKVTTSPAMTLSVTKTSATRPTWTTTCTGTSTVTITVTPVADSGTGSTPETRTLSGACSNGSFSQRHDNGAQLKSGWSYTGVATQASATSNTVNYTAS